jgi:uncharacterized protein (TIGR03435 family)
MTAGGTRLPQLATTLSTWVNRIVVDQTGLDGGYDIDLRWTPDQMLFGLGGDPPTGGAPPVDPNRPSIFTALQEQLGLKLDARRGPVEVLVIDLSAADGDAGLRAGRAVRSPQPEVQPECRSSERQMPSLTSS